MELWALGIAISAVNDGATPVPHVGRREIRPEIATSDRNRRPGAAKPLAGSQQLGRFGGR